MMGYTLKLPVFEGPFELLIEMIKDQKVDLYEVSLAKITKGYLDYIKEAAKFNLFLSAEFLLMAAYLLEMKSKGLLPQEEEELVELEQVAELLPHEDLLFQEYQGFKQLAEILSERKEIFERVFTRYSLNPGQVLPKKIEFTGDVSFEALLQAFQSVWIKTEAEERHREITPEELTVADKIKEVLSLLKEKPEIKFEDLFLRHSLIEVVVTFLSILELLKRRKIFIYQKELFGSIIIALKERISLKNE